MSGLIIAGSVGLTQGDSLLWRETGLSGGPGLESEVDVNPDTPSAFSVSQWTLMPEDEAASVEILQLPYNGGSTILDVEYSIDGGSWVSTGGIVSFTIEGLDNDVQYGVRLRAVNAVGDGAPSLTKFVTPVAPPLFSLAGDFIAAAGSANGYIGFNRGVWAAEHDWGGIYGTYDGLAALNCISSSVINDSFGVVFEGENYIFLEGINITIPGINGGDPISMTPWPNPGEPVHTVCYVYLAVGAVVFVPTTEYSFLIEQVATP